MKNVTSLMLALFIFVGSWSYIAVAQVASPSPAVVAVAAPAKVADVPNGTPIVATVNGPAKSGVMAWVESKGGFQLAVLMLMMSAMAILSGFRVALYKYDGLDMSQPVPEQFKTLTRINKICYYVGIVVDFLQGNPQHK